MPQCPKCAAALLEDYGMVKCPSCQSLLFVDMEGNAFIGSDEPAVEPPAEPVPMPDPFSVAPAVAPAESDNPWPMHELLPQEVVESAIESAGSTMEPAGFSYDEVVVDVIEHEPADEPPISASDEAPQEFISFDGFHSDPVASADQAGSLDQVIGPADDPLGLASYGNSELSQGKDGMYLFKIFISGIDSKEMREFIREAIEDSRFGWEPAELMSLVSQGNLIIERLAPVKAVILINRLKRLPLKIRWEQSAITQLDGN